jgi:tetratricopeptide (TPR) repeat protein
MYALAQAYAQCGDAVAAHACARAAAVGTLRAGERVQVGGFLAGLGWIDAAERELRAVVAAPGEADVLIHQLNARMRLSFLAAARDDDDAAAEHLRAAVGLLEKAGDVRRTDEDGRETPFRPADLRDDLAWRSFRAARAVNDRAAMDKHADELIALRPVQTEILVDVVPHLKAGGRITEAAKLFEHAYAVKRARLDAQPNEPSVMNEVAWLCARSGERLDEALELATRAVELAPDSAAYLDTAAEANFQVGRVREAVRLETLALTLEPGDAFMTEQLERFNRSAPPPPATQPNTRGSPATRPVTNW